MPFFARAALALTLLAAVAARAEPPPEMVPAGLSDMEAGRLLLRAGRLGHARAFLQQAQPSNEEERIERLFLLGQVEMRLGMPERAAGRFEAVLALRPGLTRVRLELARAYYLTGRDDEARRQFGAALADDLPPPVEDAVEGFLRRIDARKRWSVSLSASLLPEIRRPDREVVLIGGIPFRLDEEARASSGMGALVSAGVSFSPAVSTDLRGALAASAAAKVYERSAWNETTVSADLGLARLFAGGSAAGGLRLGRQWTGGDGHHRSLGPWTRLRLRLSDATRLDMAASAGYRRHDTLHRRDGWRIAASPRLVHALDGRTSIEAAPVLEMAGAKAGHHRSRLIGLGVTVSRSFAGGLSVAFTPAAHIRRYRATDPLFGTRQVDRNLRLGVRVLHRSLRYAGFAPYLGYVVRTQPLHHPDSRIPAPRRGRRSLARVLREWRSRIAPIHESEKQEEDP